MKKLTLLSICFTLFASESFGAEPSYYYKLFFGGYMSSPTEITGSDQVPALDVQLNQLAGKLNYINFKEEISEIVTQPTYHFSPKEYSNRPIEISDFDTFLTALFAKRNIQEKPNCEDRVDGTLVEERAQKFFSCYSKYFDQFIDHPLFSLNIQKMEDLDNLLIQKFQNDLSGHGFTLRVLIDRKFYLPSAGVGILGRKKSDGDIVPQASERAVQVSWTLSTAWTVDEDTYLGIICHELGHHMGGSTGSKPEKIGISSEGQADHFSSHICLERVLEDKPISIETEDDQYFYNRCLESHHNLADARKCYRIGKVGQNISLWGRNISSLKKDQISFRKVLNTGAEDLSDTVANHPGPSCTTAIFATGGLCSSRDRASCKRHGCWY
jgi:hypothetical protein